MGIAVGGSRSGTISEMNVVPLIDVLLVLLVIFMIIPHRQTGLRAEIPRPAEPASVTIPDPGIVVVVQVLADGSLKINQEPVAWESLRSRLQDVFKLRAARVGFVRGDGIVEFQVVARVIDEMQAAGVSSVGLLPPELETGR
jgi:biopolymer transport protein ExbD/biopolymer transport protein TolR